MSRKFNDFDSLEFSSPMRSKQKSSRAKPRNKATDGICHFQGKLKYSSRKMAHATLKSLSKLEGRHEARAYKCPHCESYHLTSQKVNVSLNERLEETVNNIFSREVDAVEYSVERVSKIRKVVNSR